MAEYHFLGAMGLASMAGVVGGLFGRRRERRQDRDLKRLLNKRRSLPPTPKQKRRAKAQAGRKAAQINKRRRG